MALNPFQGLKQIKEEGISQPTAGLNGPKSLSGIETSLFDSSG